MTRVNILPAEVLLDQHLQAHLNEGMRPVNDVLSGMVYHNAPKRWKLNTGHVTFHRKYAMYTRNLWVKAQGEYYNRNGTFGKYDWDVTTCLMGLPEDTLADYTPSREELRSNLARICSRWRNRGKTYTFHKKPIDTVREFRQYVQYIKDYCNIN